METSKKPAASQQQVPTRNTPRPVPHELRLAEANARFALGFSPDAPSVAALLEDIIIHGLVHPDRTNDVADAARAVSAGTMPPEAGYAVAVAVARDAAAERVLALVADVARPTDVIELSTLKASGSGRASYNGRLGWPKERQKMHAFIAENFGQRNLYMGINPRPASLADTTGQASAEDIAERRYVVLDFDNKNAPKGDDHAAMLTALRAYSPFAEVMSGNGTHLWWRVPDGTEGGSEGATGQLNAAMKGLGADTIANADRIIRLPWTINIPNVRKRQNGARLRLAVVAQRADNSAASRTPDELIALWRGHSQSDNTASSAEPAAPTPAPSSVAPQAPSKEAVLRAVSRLPNDPFDDSHFPTRNGEVAVAHAVRGSTIGTAFADDPEIRAAFIEWAAQFGDDPEHAGDLYDGIRASRTGWPHLRRMVHQRVAAAAFEDIPLDADEKARLDATPSSPHPGVEPWVAELNQRYAYVESVDRIADINVDTGQVDKWLSADQFRVRLDNQKVGNMGAGRAWLTTPRRRQHTAFGWWPVGDEPKGALNLWRGFPKGTGLAADPDWRPLSVPLADTLKPTLDFIHDVIADARQGVNEHVLNYLAWKVQHPTQRPGTAMALVGASGTGKSTLGDMLADLFGSAHSRSIPKPNQAVGQFNALLEGAMVIRLEEAFFGRDRSVRGAYKDMVTSATTNIERKGVDPIPMPNMAAIIVTSNEMSAIPHEAGERRTTFIKVSEVRRRDAAYFGALHGNWTAGGREAFLDFLLRRDVSGFNPRQALDTPEKAAASAENGDMPVQFWNDTLESGALPLMLNPDGTDPEWSAGSVTVPRSALHGAYTRFVQDRIGRSPHIEGVGELTRRLLELCPGAREAQVRPGPNQPGVRSITFPPLDECRAAFTQALGGGS